MDDNYKELLKAAAEVVAEPMYADLIKAVGPRVPEGTPLGKLVRLAEIVGKIKKQGKLVGVSSDNPHHRRR